MCAEGKYNDLMGQTHPKACVSCLPGHICRKGSVSPVLECQPGTYVKNNQCINCNPGYKCSNGIKIACQEGYYSKEKSSICLPCPEGYYCLGAMSPIPTQIGYFSPQQSSKQIPCPPGFYNDENLLGSCKIKICHKGTYASSFGSSNCSKCTSDCLGGSILDYSSLQINEFETITDLRDLPRKDTNLRNGLGFGLAAGFFACGLFISLCVFALELALRKLLHFSLLQMMDLLVKRHYKPLNSEVRYSRSSLGGLFSVGIIIAFVVTWTIMIVSFWTTSLGFTESVRPLNDHRSEYLEFEMSFQVITFGATAYNVSIDQTVGFQSNGSYPGFRSISKWSNKTHSMQLWNCWNCSFLESTGILKVRIEGQTPIRIIQFIINGTIVDKGVLKPFNATMNYNLARKGTDKLRMFNPEKSSTISTTLMRRQHDTYQSDQKRFIGAFIGGQTKKYQFYAWQYQGSKEEEVELQSLERYVASFEWSVVESKSILEANAVYSTTMLTLISQMHAISSGIIALAALMMVTIEKFYQWFTQRHRKSKKSSPQDDLEVPLMDLHCGRDKQHQDSSLTQDELLSIVNHRLNTFSHEMNVRMEKSLARIQNQLQAITKQQNENLQG